MELASDKTHLSFIRITIFLLNTKVGMSFEYKNGEV